MRGYVWCIQTEDIQEGFGSGMLQCYSKERKMYFLMEGWPYICGTTFCFGQFLGAGWEASWGQKEHCLNINHIPKGWEKLFVSSHWDAVPPQAWRTKVAPWVGGSSGCQCKCRVLNPGEVTCCCSGRALPQRYTCAALGLGRSRGWIHVRAGWEALPCLALGSTRLCKAILAPLGDKQVLGNGSCATGKVLVACKWR